MQMAGTQFYFNRNVPRSFTSQMQGNIHRCVHCCMGRNAKNGSGQCLPITHTQIEQIRFAHDATLCNQRKSNVRMPR